MKLIQTKTSDHRLKARMAVHYSQPKGVVGRRICYAIEHEGEYYGHIIAGSAVRHLKQRDEWIGGRPEDLNGIVNNIFYNVSPVGNRYPFRNFTVAVLKQFRMTVTVDWYQKYGDPVTYFETLVEPPRSGEVYRRDGWSELGMTKGMTCKRVAGKEKGKWGDLGLGSGKRVWDRENLRPKLIFCRKNILTEYAGLAI